METVAVTAEHVYISTTEKYFAFYWCRYKFNIIHHYLTFLLCGLYFEFFPKWKLDPSWNKFTWLCDSFMIRRQFRIIFPFLYSPPIDTITSSFFFCCNHQSNFPLFFTTLATLSHLLSVSDVLIILLIMKHLPCACFISLLIVFWAMKSDSLDQHPLLQSSFYSPSVLIKHLRKMTLTVMGTVTNITIQPIIMD